MEEGYYWVQQAGLEPEIAEFKRGSWYFIGDDCYYPEVMDGFVVGPRVKGQEECQSDD